MDDDQTGLAMADPVSVTPVSILLCTNQFYRWAGSELVIIELAEEFINRGVKTTILSNSCGGPLEAEAIKLGAKVTDDPTSLNLFEFDIVYSQHHVLPLVIRSAINQGLEPSNQFPFFIYSHLAPLSPYEWPGPFIEKYFADLVLATSLGTKEFLSQFKEMPKAQLFPNPAPLRFEKTDASSAETLRSLLVVSNHLPDELVQALDIVKKRGIKIEKVGRKFTHTRLIPDHIARNDGVVTIGKTAQYALLGKRPVFCYDHFAGPGWLTNETFEDAAWYNFSGRCTPQKRIPEILANEIIEGYPLAKKLAEDLSDERLAYFRLKNHVNDFIAKWRSFKDNHERHEQLKKTYRDPEFRILVQHEAKISELIRDEFRKKRRLEFKLEKKRAGLLSALFGKSY